MNDVTFSSEVMKPASTSVEVIAVSEAACILFVSRICPGAFRFRASRAAADRIAAEFTAAGLVCNVVGEHGIYAEAMARAAKRADARASRWLSVLAAWRRWMKLTH